MSKLNGDTRHIPKTFNDESLNLRAFVELPTRQVTLEDEVKAIIQGVRTRLISPDRATWQLLGIIGREQEQFELAVKRALIPGGGE